MHSALRRCRRSLPHRCHRQHLCGARRPGGHGSITRATFSAELIRSSLIETTHDGPRRIVASVNVDERRTNHPRGRGRPDPRSVRRDRSDRRQGEGNTPAPCSATGSCGVDPDLAKGRPRSGVAGPTAAASSPTTFVGVATRKSGVVTPPQTMWRPQRCRLATPFANLSPTHCQILVDTSRHSLDESLT